MNNLISENEILIGYHDYHEMSKDRKVDYNF